MTGYLLWAVWSLNERAAGREGADLPRPSGDYLGDVVKLYEARLEREARALRNG